MKLLTIFFAAAMSLATVAHAGPNAAVLQNLAQNVIQQTYIDLADSAKTMQGKIATLKSEPTQANLNAAQDAWRQMRVHWEASEAFLFGPVEGLGIDPMIDTWPLNRLDLQGVLNSGRDLSVDFVRNLGANMQGFHTLEFLLFGDGVTTNTKAASTLTARQIEYMESTVALLVEYTGKLAHAWTTNSNPDDPSVPGYTSILSSPNLNNPVYPSEQAVLAELVNGMIGIIDEVGTGKIPDPAGADVAHANVSLVESPFSWNSLSDFANNIRSALEIYTGQYGTHTGPGIRDVVAHADKQLSAQVEQNIRDCIQNILDIAGPQNLPFRQEITDPQARGRIQTATQSLINLRETLKTRVLPIVQE